MYTFEPHHLTCDFCGKPMGLHELHGGRGYQRAKQGHKVCKRAARQAAKAAKTPDFPGDRTTHPGLARLWDKTHSK